MFQERPQCPKGIETPEDNPNTWLRRRTACNDKAFLSTQQDNSKELLLSNMFVISQNTTLHRLKYCSFERDCVDKTFSILRLNKETRKENSRFEFSIYMMYTRSLNCQFKYENIFVFTTLPCKSRTV